MYARVLLITLGFGVLSAEAGLIAGLSDSEEEKLLSLADVENLQPAYEYGAPPPVAVTAVRTINPHVEILHLIETGLKLKGEIISKLHRVIYDNFDLFKSVFKIVTVKVVKLYKFVLLAIRVIKRCFEFALNVVSSWKHGLPNLGIDLSHVLEHNYAAPEEIEQSWEESPLPEYEAGQF